MLRPATPLTILLAVSFILLLLSVISTPIVKGIPIATFQGVNFGVFGYCKGSSCSGIKIGYTTDGLFGSSSNSDAFDLPSSARHSLSSLLIVHPVAAFCNLVCLALAAAAHLHSPSHSARYLLGLLILLLPTLLVTLLAFLVDILLFVPHLQWGGWIVLASTILITASGVVTCAMRRTLVSRKARKRRIAENAEMSGENYYNRQNDEPKYNAPFVGPEPRAPMVNGAPGADKLPAFATFEQRQRTSDEERQPLNQQIPPSTAASNTLVEQRDDGSDRYGPPRSRSRGRYDGPRDEFGNPLPPSTAFGPTQPPLPVTDNLSGTSRPMEQYQNDPMRPPRGGGFGPGRGRGAYPPRGGPRGGGYGGPRMPPPGNMGRGGFGGDPRGGYNHRGRGSYPMGPIAAGAAGGVVAGAAMDRSRRGPPPTYPTTDHDLPPEQFDQPIHRQDMLPNQDQDSEYGSQQYSAYGARQPSPGAGLRSQSPRTPLPASPGAGLRPQSPHGSLPGSPGRTYRNPSPPPPMPPMVPGMGPVGQAVEMDATHGQRSELSSGYGSNQLRASDSDVEGMVDLQQNRAAFDSNQGSLRSQSGVRSPAEYVPPRRGWTRGPVGPSDDMTATVHDRTTAAPVELPASNSSVGEYRPAGRGRINSGGSDSYYEDVNPRFAPEAEPLSHPPQNTVAPTNLAPGDDPLRPFPFVQTSSYEDLQQGARSPAESENSNFTSVSQRGVNPNWRPGGPGDIGNFPPHVMRKPLQHHTQQRRDVLLGTNPDFELPIARNTRGRGGMTRGGGGRMPAPMSSYSGGGRYPGTEI